MLLEDRAGASSLWHSVIKEYCVLSAMFFTFVAPDGAVGYHCYGSHLLNSSRSVLSNYQRVCRLVFPTKASVISLTGSRVLVKWIPRHMPKFGLWKRQDVGGKTIICLILRALL